MCCINHSLFSLLINIKLYSNICTQQSPHQLCVSFCLFVGNNKCYYLHFAYGFFPLLPCHLWASHRPFFSKSNHVDQCTRWPYKTHMAHGTWHHTSPLSFSLSCAVVAWEREYVVKIYTLRKRRKNAFLFFSSLFWGKRMGFINAGILELTPH